MLKKIITLGIIFGDILLIIWLISMLGIVAFARFSAGYLIGIIISTIILVLIGYSNERTWEAKYDSIEGKVNPIKAVFLAALILIGLVLVILGVYPFYGGVVTGIAVGVYLMMFFSEILHYIVLMRGHLDGMLLKKLGRWFK